MRLNELYRRYQDRVQFFTVYIREAHPDNGWQVPNNLIENIVYDEPRTADERAAIANACQLHMAIEMPMLLDGIDNDADRKYVGLPMRQFLIDRDGRVAYAGDKGPFGWDDGAFERSLVELLA